VTLGLCVGFAPGRASDQTRTVTEVEVEGGRDNSQHEAVRASVGTRASTSATATLYRGHTAYYWAHKFKRRTRQYLRVRRVLLTSPKVSEAINLAGATHGNTGLLWSLARCETGGTFSPTAKNPHSDASGLFQFMPSTFASTPYGGMSIWSPYANAMAAGWMLAHGRRGEWVC